MATRAIKHHRWCLLSPPLPSRLSILRWGWRNSLSGSTKMGRWRVGAASQHKMCSGGGTDETIGPRLVRIGSMNDRWAVYRSGDVTINWVEGDGGGRHNKLQHSYFSPEPIRGQGHPILLQTQQ
jgi:hypothetical protein